MSATIGRSDTHHRLLAELVCKEAAEVGDPAGWHHVVINVLAELREPHETTSDLANAVYELIAASMLPIDAEDGETS